MGAFSLQDFSPIMLVTNRDDPGDYDVEPLARSLLKHGASLEIADRVQLTSCCHRACIRTSVVLLQRGWTPLMTASTLKMENLVRLYLEHGADPNRQDSVGWSALMAAAKHDAGEIAKLLIESGAKLEMAIVRRICH